MSGLSGANCQVTTEAAPPRLLHVERRPGLGTRRLETIQEEGDAVQIHHHQISSNNLKPSAAGFSPFAKVDFPPNKKQSSSNYAVAN
ncbi:hypothetical protein ACJRO7_028738 [Eucalyptus globulus]|uniref:Uncharacterized protein n=1 Tax=Eucalyptus globulus TaxID=34317 RepID=A0ABD3K5G4_EUCGL